MKRTFFAFFLLFTLFTSGCSPNQVSTDANRTVVKPYQLTAQEEELLRLTPIEQGSIQMYEVIIPNKQDEIRMTVEHYHNGTKAEDSNSFSSSQFENETVKLSFGQQSFQYENDTREAVQWFINISSASMKFVDESPPEWSVSGFTSIQEEKKITYNEKVVLSAWISTDKENGISDIPPEDEESTEELIAQNEHVYLFVIEIKNGDVSK